MEASDESLLDRYREGDVRALQELVERYKRPLFGFILNSSGGQVDADEVFQEMWFRAIRRLDSYEHGNFPGWLFRICHNLLIDMARSRKRLVSLDEEPEEGDSAADRLADAGPSPSEKAADRDLGRRIREAVETLPPEQKEVFLLRVEADLPFKEIAAMQEVSINTALGRMHYALTKLREALKQDYRSLREEL